MVRKIFLGIAATAAVSIGAPAQAAYVTATYSGTVSAVDVYDGDTGTTFSQGENVSYSVTFDPSTLVDHTSTVNASLLQGYGPSAVQFASVLTGSLSDDPGASLSITVGNTTFSKFNQIAYGTPDSDTSVDLGSGDFPIVEYLNGSFAGIGGVFHIKHGITLYTDPIAAANDAFQDPNTLLNHDFELDDPTSDGQGNYNGAPVFSVSAVPEPTTWAMMIGGLGLVGGAMRRRRSVGLALA